ncbi:MULTISPECIES: SDR family oxidoreductase [unclassified Paracoccus (in: a-proteobacteria)]|uniref:SDR family oxidoreductase n=1 Tax=unclassified Paracoccus (in: a-proteobacteria) TaxID=2688777 RepID=UPI001601F8A1|nr:MULTISPECIES: SDR family oxidoreductase [unclassified Paracoccus (in: a-proteobacteria)]MBB1490955.1 SDR family oxidoreductase [Paracoccus sp. MC1854]MBB1498906.1 SDR family oxidoreductase [Paracoccus sp. MC1862]QQO45193.1 SDR family oxidoreductase [Paracoccus sp. MC1862]
MTGKTLFITGASSGIGAATARLAVAHGWRVGLFARREDRLRALVAELGEDRALTLPGDVTDLADLQTALERMSDRFGAVDAAFANAGRGLNAAGTEGGDPGEWQDMIRINVMGLLFTAKAALPFLKKTQGHLLMTGSAAGRVHIKGSVYGASKWFVHGYGGNLAEEMREWGGRCTVIAPGMVDTDFFDEAKPKAIRPDEVARAALYALEAGDHAAVREVFLMPR